jgi:hypothetical protein
VEQAKLQVVVMDDLRYQSILWPGGFPVTSKKVTTISPLYPIEAVEIERFDRSMVYAPPLDFD